MGMTQNYVGSNNVNLFIPHGNYGTRGRWGEDQSAPRYLHIELSPIARLIFLDDESSDQQGKEVKPGRNWSWVEYQCPSYHPIHIIKNMMHLIDFKGNVDKLPVEMRPWYKGFHGRIEGSQSSDGNYTSYGYFQFRIKQYYMLQGYKKYGDDASPIDIRVKLSVLVEFYKIGMEQYQTRLNNLRNKKAAEVLKLRSELDFVKRYHEGNIILSNDHMQKNVDLLEYIKHQGFEDNPENLASLKLVSLTKESETALKKELAKMEEELNKVENKAAATRLRAINATGYVNVTRRDISAWFNLFLSFVKLQTGPLAAYCKLSLNHVLVFHDDMTLPCGVLRLYVPNGGHVYHNGLKSVIYHFRGYREFPWPRFGEFEFPNFMNLNDLFPVLESMLNILPGIGRPPGQMDPKAFLLQKFNATARRRVIIWWLCVCLR
ncbi:DNA topoisomerase 2-like [Pyrus ussuriensis x Pyrus communis]|uniref:DNA topoisomerase (ATP-hydrolyzing) n=1 Tax=Pyrus ussuriensis x Pyrus communis TaxID=2448454 RepID=A0A5N5FWU1_9ROSA|nr:DNA topoisomerase 2-like [Pyrus ussuriensis x Pyrus communis]